MIHKPISKEEFLRAVDLHSRFNHYRQKSNYEGPYLPEMGELLALTDTLISDVDVVGLNLESIILVRCVLRNVRLINCQIAGGDLFDSVFDNCCIINCMLHKCDCHNANYDGVDFTNSTLRRSYFGECTMKYANFTDCNLTGSHFSNADMRFAVLENVDFTEVILSKTKMFNNSKFHLGKIDRAIVRSIDMSPDGDGSMMMGIEALKALQIKTSETCIF